MIEGLRRAPRANLFVATAILILIALSIANFADVTGNDSGSDSDLAAFLILSAVSIAIAAGMFLRLVPGTESDADTENKPARLGLVFSIVALITVLAFWSGFPFAFGVPALVLGAEGTARAATQGRGPEATAAVVISAFAILAAFVFCVVG